MIVITGGAGFLGSVLLAHLNSLGQKEILIVDNLDRGDKWKNLNGKHFLDFIHKDKFIEDVRRDRLKWEIDAVVHLGASSSTTENDANYLMENNFHYSRDLCLYALEHEARFINASSAATFGDGKCGFHNSTEAIEKLRPLNVYGFSKQLLDLWLLQKRLADLVVSLKFFNVYGPNEYHKGSMASVIFKFFNEINRTGRTELFESTSCDIANGEQKRDFVYVKDCARLMAWLLDDGKNVNGILNVGTGKAESFNDVAVSVFHILKKPVDIEYIPMPKGIASQYQDYTCADMSWLDKNKCPVKFRDIKAGAEDYIENYLGKPKKYL